jgi:ribosome-associated translation inhibitor RaiA
MIMRNRFKKMVDYGLSEISRIAPFNSDVELDVKEDAKGHFYSFIKVKVNRKIFIAKKEGNNMYESFHKALKALKVQLAKNKINHRVHRSLRYEVA